ncbi:hypothetical protein BD309DRAFT_253245 [Dichomitus squalens]|nr:hypothetical protein BD309DRAFT_253245 [Dichomitus squalens]
MRYNQYIQSRQSASVHNIPLELLYNFFEHLDNHSIRACTLVCERWRLISQRLLFRAPRLSDLASLDSFCRLVDCNPDLANAVRDLHIRGKTDYSSMRPTPWILQVPLRLLNLLPNLRSITFDQIERVQFSADFWTELEKFTPKVTSLTIKASRFYFDTDLRDLIFAFPNLTSLTLSNVHWGRADETVCPPPRWGRILPLRTLRLNHVPGRSEYVTLFDWLSRSKTVRELEVLQYSHEAFDLLVNYLHQLADKGRSLLESFSFSPSAVLYGRDYVVTYPELGAALRRHVLLRDLHLHIPNMMNGPMAWVPRLLRDLDPAPLTHIALDFTLDVDNADHLTPDWSETNSRLQSQWRKTLQKVTLTHYPVGHFLSDSTAQYILTTRLEHLNERKMLDVFIGERYG